MNRPCPPSSALWAPSSCCCSSSWTWPTATTTGKMRTTITTTRTTTTISTKGWQYYSTSSRTWLRPWAQAWRWWVGSLRGREGQVYLERIWIPWFASFVNNVEGVKMKLDSEDISKGTDVLIQHFFCKLFLRRQIQNVTSRLPLTVDKRKRFLKWVINHFSVHNMSTFQNKWAWCHNKANFKEKLNKLFHFLHFDRFGP